MATPDPTIKAGDNSASSALSMVTAQQADLSGLMASVKSIVSNPAVLLTQSMQTQLGVTASDFKATVAYTPTPVPATPWVIKSASSPLPTQTLDPSTSTVPTTKSSSLSGGAIAGIAIAGVVVVIAAICAVVVYNRRKLRVVVPVTPKLVTVIPI